MLLAASLLVTLVVAEVVVRFFVPVRNVGPSFSEYDPMYGKRLKANFRCERITPEFTMRFTTNSLGFRGPEPPETPRNGILFLGDSYTEGYGVSDGEEFAAIVRDTLKAVYGPTAPPVLNLGMGNIGNGRWLKFIRREGVTFAPQFVVLQVTSNDFFDNAYENMFALGPGDSLIEAPIPKPGMSRYTQALIEAVPGLAYSRLLGLIRQLSWTLTQGSQETVTAIDTDPRTKRLTYRIVEEIIAECTMRSWPVIVMTFDLPEEDVVPFAVISGRYGARLLRIPTPHERPDLYYQIDGHMNVRGNRFVASLLIQMIDEMHIFEQ